MEDNSLVHIQLQQDEFTAFETMLSPNWNIANQRETDLKLHLMLYTKHTRLLNWCMCFCV